MMKKVFLALAALHLLCSSPALAQTKKILDIQSIKTPGGVELWFVQDKTVPVLTLSFAFRGGIAQDPPEKAGLAFMTSILLDEGAGTYDSQTFQQALQKNAINLSFNAGRDAFYGELRTLTKNRAKAFELLKLSITSPRFDPDAIARMRAAHMAKIRRDMGNPNWTAGRVFNGTAFEGHIYAQPGYGNLKTVGQITREDLSAYVAKNFARKNLVIAAAGDIDPAELTAVVDDIFGGLPAKPDLAKIPDMKELRGAGKTTLLEMDIPQTIVTMGQPAVPRKHKDWYALRLVNFILGESGFGSRLMEEIREKRGLTYGIYSNIANQDHANLIQLNTSTVNEKTGEVLSLIRQEWKRMAETGPTEKELENAKAYLIGALPLQLTSTADIANALLGLQLDELPIDYLDKRQTELRAIRLEDSRQAANKYLAPEALSVVLVGRPLGITPDIRLEKPPGME